MAKTTINENLCKGCALCVEVCPKKIIHLQQDKLNAKGYTPAYISEEDMEKCIACAFCGMMCPDSAIVVEKQNATKKGSGTYI